MAAAPIPETESARLQVLRQMRLLDTHDEAEFDHIAALAARLCGAATALVSLVDEHRQWFKARHGLLLSESPRDDAFCAHAILHAEVLWVEDACRDERFIDNRFVREHPQIRFYAGAPISIRGENIGTVCVFGPEPRPFDASAADVLTSLAGLAASQIEARLNRQLADIAVQVTATTTDAVICCDEDGRVTFWNTAAETLFGWPAEAMLGEAVDRISPAAAWSSYEDLFRPGATLRRGSADGAPEIILQNRHGQLLTVELSVASYKVAERWQTAAIIRDCRPRRRAEAAAAAERAGREAAQRESAASRTALALFVGQSPAPLLMTDKDLTILRVSTSWQAFYGLTASAVVGRKIHELFPAATETWGPIYARCLEGAAESGLVQSTYAKVADQACWMRWNVSPWRDADGQVGGLMLVNLDVTDLVEARESARRSEQAKSSFLANVSHEIRTPLNGILGLTSVLRRKALSSEQAEILSTIEASATHLGVLLSDILDFARLEEDDLKLHLAAFNIAEVARDLASTFSPMATAKGLAFEVEIAPERSALHLGDATRLRQVLTQLLSNALKFTSQGTIRLAIGPAPEGDDKVAFVVQDSGCGFAPSTAEALFAAFQQADGSAQRETGGIGLGLSICAAITKLMGGTIEARSTAGAGATFTLIIPLPPADPTLAADVEQELPAESLRVLLAEDHPVNRQIVELILLQAGIDLVAVENGREAVACAGAERFDAILMDMQMPVMDGLAAIRQIRTLEVESGAPRIPILTLTANALPEHRAAAAAAGSDGFMTKPVTADRLLSALAEVLAITS